jgi:hypothetical protein
MFCRHQHHQQHAFASFRPLEQEGLVLQTRRNFMKVSLAGLAGLSVPGLLQCKAQALAQGQATPSHKSVILLWMAGGPSHIDTWDVKPNRPLNNRGPFAAIQTALPGVQICEYLPRQAAMLDKFTIIRSVDATHSNHEPNRVFQTGSRAAAPRVNPTGHLYPAIGSVVAKHHGANTPGMPPYVVFMRSPTHIAFAGYLGRQYDPFIGNHAAALPIYDVVGVPTGQMTQPDLLNMPAGMTEAALHERHDLLQAFDELRTDLDHTGAMEAMDQYQQQAVGMLLGQHVRDAFDLTREPPATRDRYGSHLWCQQALLARRLVEAL